jgi:hypothetical protein
MMRLGDEGLLSGSFGQEGKIALYKWRTGETIKIKTAGNIGFNAFL